MSLSPAWCGAGMASGSRREEGSAHPHWCLLCLRKYQNTGASTTGAKPRAGGSGAMALEVELPMFRAAICLERQQGWHRYPDALSPCLGSGQAWLWIPAPSPSGLGLSAEGKPQRFAELFQAILPPGKVGDSSHAGEGCCSPVPCRKPQITLPELPAPATAPGREQDQAAGSRA